MNYILIKGHFRVVNYSPDGDTVKFVASNPRLWEEIISDYRDVLLTKFEGVKKEDKLADVRLQGVDALETHYTPSGLNKPDDISASQNKDKPSPGRHRQPGDIGKQATHFLLHSLGVLDSEWFRSIKINKVLIKKGRKKVWVSSDVSKEIPGYIITRYIDRKGRPIAWIFGGKTRSKDGKAMTGSQVARKIKQSVNYKLLRKGLVYPYFYMTLPSSIRDELIEAVQEAKQNAMPFLRSKKKRTSEIKRLQTEATADGLYEPQKVPNVWVYDRTDKGISISELKNITDEMEIWPYLFRKLLKHWYRSNLQNYWTAKRKRKAYDPDTELKLSLDAFFETGNPYVFVISTQNFVPLNEILEVKKGRLVLNKSPHDVVFLS